MRSIHALVLVGVIACGSLPEGRALGPASATAAAPAGVKGFDGVILPVLDQWQGSYPAMATIAGAAPGSARITSETGGWTMDVPASWRADAWVLRGARVYSDVAREANPDAVARAKGAVRISVALDRRAPADDAETHKPHLHGFGKVLDQRPLTLAGQRAHVMTVTPGLPPPHHQAIRYWVLATPHFADRLLVITAFGADEPETMTEAERVVSTLRFVPPVSGPALPLLTRAEVLARETAPNGKPAPVTRAEAKLVLMKEFEVTQGSRSTSPDPETPVWVVVVAGPHVAAQAGSGRRGPAGANASGTPPEWQVRAFDARTGVGFMGGYGPGLWPSWWDTLADRAP